MARRTLPRRETLAFIEGLTDQIVLQDMRTGEHTVSVLDPFAPATGLLRYGNLEFSPDGRMILFNTLRHIWLADVSKVK